jgi:cell division protein FtsW
MRKTSSTLIAIVLALLSLGIVMLASTSSVRGVARFGDPHYFLKRQLIWLSLAVAAGVIATRFDYHWLRRLSVPLAVVSVVLLALVVVPGIGTEVGGSRRWLRLGPMSVRWLLFPESARRWGEAGGGFGWAP